MNCKVQSAKKIDLVGQTFGQLRVIGHAGFSARGRSLWRCVDDSGYIGVVRRDDLTSGRKRSFGSRKRGL